MEEASYGYGFWVENDRTLIGLEGYDAGVSFYSGVSPDLKIMFTVIANDRSGAWPIVKVVKEALF